MELDGNAAAFSMHALAPWPRHRVRSNGLQRVAYRDTEHYRLTRAFLEQPQRMLETLLDDD